MSIQPEMPSFPFIFSLCFSLSLSLSLSLVFYFSHPFASFFFCFQLDQDQFSNVNYAHPRPRNEGTPRQSFFFQKCASVPSADGAKAPTNWIYHRTSTRYLSPGSLILLPLRSRHDPIRPDPSDAFQLNHEWNIHARHVGIENGWFHFEPWVSHYQLIDYTWQIDATLTVNCTDFSPTRSYTILQANNSERVLNGKDGRP